jgi:hypothetical protein
MHAYRPLQIVDGRKRGWIKELVKIADTKRNFVAILEDEKILKILCRTLDCHPRLPEKLGRWGLHALADLLEPSDYTQLLETYEQNPVYLVEQLRLGRNHPPRCKPYILYCEMRGIISDHKTWDEACLSLLDYLDSFKRARLFPLAGIYNFSDGKWSRVKKMSSHT